MSGGGISVREVQVRRVRADEVERWNAPAREHHYLGFKKFCGNQLRHVAVPGEHWLALAGWQAALYCGTQAAGSAGRRCRGARGCSWW